MKPRIRMSASLFIAAVVACMLAWPPAMAAATPGDRDGSQAAQPGLSFRFDKDAFGLPGTQAGAGASRSASKFSIKLYGGYSRIAAADVNTGSDFYFELLEFYQAQGMGTITDGYDPLHGGYNLGADFIFQITPRIGIGLGAGYMRNSAESLATFTQDPFEVDILAESTITAIPIRLGLFLTFPLGGKLNLTADAGAAYYARLKLEAMQGMDYPDGTWLHRTLSGERSGFANLGFHGSLGVEYKLSPMMGFFVEVLGRYASFKNFESVIGTTVANGGLPDTTEGKLYIATEDIDGTPITLFTIVETGGTVDPTYREPKIDLSGFSLQTGIRIRF